MYWIKKISQSTDEQKQPLYDLRRDGKLIFRGPEIDCLKRLHNETSSSAHWATKYEGYTLSPMDEDWQKHYNWYGGD